MHRAFQELIDFLTEDTSPNQYWCKSTSFDFPILEHIFRLLKGTPPWEIWQIYDMRTVWNLTFHRKKAPPAPHNALADCRTQTQQLAEANIKVLPRAALGGALISR